MKTLKTAEELHSRSVNYFDEKHNPVITLESFKEALEVHDKEIRDKIEEMIEKYKKVAEHWKEQYHNKGGDSLYTLMIDANAKIAALTELLTFIKTTIEEK